MGPTSLSETVFSISEAVDLACGLDPVSAIKSGRDEDAAILWVDNIRGDNGNILPLMPVSNNGENGKYIGNHKDDGRAFIYGRVRTPRQYEREFHGEGWSMRTQFERCIRYVISQNLDRGKVPWRFCIFSDTSLSGGMPTNDATLIERLWRTDSREKGAP